jgi:carbamoylphosphate synthase large subunit
MAAQIGVRTPPSAPVASWEGLSEWIDRNGLPAYLKVDGSHGGNGVEEVRTKPEALRVFKRMSAPPSLVAVLKYLIKQQDFGRLGSFLRRRGGVVSVQSTVEGHPANCLAVCKEGDVTAYIGAEVCATAKATGFGTLIRVSDNFDMENAARAIARRLGLNGVFGLDFVVESNGGRAHLIEMNPRVTPLAHFRFGPGHDPAAALRALAAGYNENQARPGEAGSRRPEGLIAVFPHMLSLGVPEADGQPVLVDVPWDLPELVRLSMPLPSDLFGFAYEVLSRFFL